MTNIWFNYNHSIAYLEDNNDKRNCLNVKWLYSIVVGGRSFIIAGSPLNMYAVVYIECLRDISGMDIACIQP